MVPDRCRHPLVSSAGCWLAGLLAASVVVVGLIVYVTAGGSGSGADRAGGAGSGAAQPGQPLAVGSVAQPVRLAATSGRTVDLAGFRNKRNVLLYFYEHAG